MQGRKTESSGGDEGIQHVDAKAIKTSLHARVSYLLSFIGFNSADVQALQNVAPLIRPHITAIVDSMYRKLMSYDITKASLIEPSGAHVPREEIVTKERDRIRYMTSFMSHWVLKLFIADWEDIQTFAYFDRVGVSHVGQSAFRHRGERGSLNVDYVHIALLLGVLTEALTTRILGFDKLTLEEKTAALSALTKAMWIQNDLISRHYVVPVEKLLPPEPPAPAHPYVPADDEPKCPFSGKMKAVNLTNP
ncbi:hypothetical protein FRB99_006186 [Tulasnella sp. 403]|nr:hypothetical protein FRB99_006186 [Tulasnella sp. 403]